MQLNRHLQPLVLERRSFMWSEIRLLIAALALFLGGVPPLTKLSLPFTSTLLTVAWIISGLASLYLLYMWNVNKRTVFGHNRKLDTIAFFIMVISGINLGIVGLTKINIGMKISSNQVIFVIVGLLYIWAAYHLYRRWSNYGNKVF
jgi:uncharacterized membrane protein YuzA (DUF378 family)